MSQVLVKEPQRPKAQTFKFVLLPWILSALFVQLPESRFAYCLASLSYNFSSWESLTRSREQQRQYRTRSQARSSRPQLLPRYKRCCPTSPGGGAGVVCLCELVELTARVLLLLYTFFETDQQTQRLADRQGWGAQGERGSSRGRHQGIPFAGTRSRQGRREAGGRCWGCKEGTG